MEQNSYLWNASCKKAFYGFLAFMLGTIVINFLSWIALGSTIASIANGSAAGVGATGIVMIIVNILVILGYVYFLIGTKGMQRSTPTEADNNSVKPVFIGALLCVIGAGLDLIPLFPGFVIGILSLLGYIFMMIGFNKIKQSQNFSEPVRQGGSKLFVSMLLAVIASGLGFIPIAGRIIEAILFIIVLVFGIIGWKQIARA